MKTGLTRFPAESQSKSSRRWKNQGAFTLPGLMVSMSILLLVIGGVLASHLFGLRMVEITKIKLTVNDSIPRGIEEMRSEVQSAKRVRIGSGSLTAFTQIAENTPQTGNSIQVYPGSDTNLFVRYYLDTQDNALKRLGTNSAVKVVVETLLYTPVFAAEDFKGTILTNKDDCSIISLKFFLSELKGSGVKFGPGNHYSSFPMQTKMVRRVKE